MPGLIVSERASVRAAVTGLGKHERGDAGMSAREHFDVVVVWSGFGGSVSAYRYA